MSLKFDYYGQNYGTVVPDVALVGDPGTDITTLQAAGYYGGTLIALKTSATAGRGVVGVPCDGNTMVPFGTLINDAGEFSSSLGPSGSGKMAVARVGWTGTTTRYVAAPVAPYTVGAYLYAGTGGDVGKYTTDSPGGVATKVGIVTHIPTAGEPWLGVASII